MRLSRFSIFVLLSPLTVGLGVVSPRVAHAQQGTVSAPVLIQGDGADAGETRRQNAPVRTRTVADVASALTRGANGAFVVADSSVTALPAPLPQEATTPENLQKQVEALVSTLPKGTTWAKLYLPAPLSVRRGYNGDDVAAYALAQSKLVGPVGAVLPPGTVEIMGQKVPQEKADAFIAGLNLKMVYLITNPRTAAPSGFGLTMDASKWAAMSPAERQEFTRQQANSLSQMDPAARNQMMQQNMMIFAQFMQNASPQDRQNMIQGMMGPGGSGNVIIRTMPAGTPLP